MRLAGKSARGVRDRSRSAARKLREINRTVARRTGEAKSTVLRLTGEAGELVKRSVRETRRLATRLRERSHGRGAKAKLTAARQLDELADRAEKIARQIDQRLAGEQITDRLVSMFDPDARPIRKGKLRAPTEFGYVFQFAEITENTRRGARGLLLPAPTTLGNPKEDTLLAATAARTPAARAHAARRRAGRGLYPGSDRHRAARLRARVHRRPTIHRLAAQRSPAREVPRRLRRTHQPPQAPLRHPPQQPQRPTRSANLGRLERADLQPRHARHPERLTRSDPFRIIHPEPIRTTAAPEKRGRVRSQPGPFIRGK